MFHSHPRPVVGANGTLVDADLTYSLNSKKIILTFGMLVATLIAGMLPLKLAGPRARKYLPFLSCFSGGVFMAACVMDLIPDVEESVNHVLVEIKAQYGIDIDYPVAETIIVVGFIMVLIVEQAVLAYREKQARQGYAQIEGDNSPRRQDETDSLLDDTNATSNNRPVHVHNDYQRNPNAEVEDQMIDHDHHDHHHLVEQTSLRAILLTVALSFHSLFEGLAIGLQTSADAMFALLAAVMIHKGVMAFSLGLSVMQSGLKRKSFFISLIIFSAASPLGVVLGMLITSLQESLARDVANAVLQGISGGTFLYVTFFEVLPQELNKPQNRLWKVLSVIIGVAAIGGVLLITN